MYGNIYIYIYGYDLVDVDSIHFYIMTHVILSIYKKYYFQIISLIGLNHREVATLPVLGITLYTLYNNEYNRIKINVLHTLL